MGKASRKKRPEPAPGAGRAGEPPPTAGAERAPTTAAGGIATDVEGTSAEIPWITRPLLLILAAAAIFRVAYLLQYHAASVFFSTPFLDAWIYDSWARRIAGGEWSPPEPFYFAPGYPYLLAIFYKLVSSQVAAVYVLQHALGLVSIVLIHRLTWRAFGARAATWAAALAALYASFPFLEAKVMSTTPALALMLASLTVLEAASRRGAWWRWGAAGLLLGVTSLLRPETLLAGPFLLIWIWRSAGMERAARPPSDAPRREAPRSAAGRWGLPMAALLAGWAIAITPAALHNMSTGGGSTLISSQGGITFYQSNNPRARGLYVFLSREGFSGSPEKQAQEEKEIAEKAVGRPLSRSEVSSYWFSKGLDFVRSQPGRFLWLLGMKLLRFIGSYEYSTEYILYVERETVPLLWLPFVPFALLVALAVPSIARLLLAARSRRPTVPPAAWLLLAILAANLATVLAFYVSSRYRLPSAPPLMAFAGSTIAGLVEAWRRGRRTDVWITVGVVAGLFLLSHFEKDASATIQEANVHFNTGNVLSGKKEPERALAEFRRAIEMDDSRYDFFYNEGNTLRDLGRRAEAAAAYGEAAKRRPQFVNAHARRGQMLLEEGDFAGAREALLKADALRPEEFDVQLMLGKAAAGLGDRDEAIRRFDHALRLRPGNEAALAERAKLP